MIAGRAVRRQFHRREIFEERDRRRGKATVASSGATLTASLPGPGSQATRWWLPEHARLIGGIHVWGLENIVYFGTDTHYVRLDDGDFIRASTSAAVPSSGCRSASRRR
jgi:hypothetical protein